MPYGDEVLALEQPLTPAALRSQGPNSMIAESCSPSRAAPEESLRLDQVSMIAAGQRFLHEALWTGTPEVKFPGGSSLACPASTILSCASARAHCLNRHASLWRAGYVPRSDAVLSLRARDCHALRVCIRSVRGEERIQPRDEA